MYSRALESISFHKFYLEIDLRKALEKGEFELYYQPLVDIRSREVVGFEALLRWNHPLKGMVSPLDFVPLAEESGIIKPISEWVLRKACRDLKQMMKDSHQSLQMGINISASQFYDKYFVHGIKRVLEEEDIPGHNIKLEITESILLENNKETVKVLKELRELGIQVYIDDFGTGYSSLSYLKRFPVSGVKIDKSFTVNSLSNDEDKEIVKAIIHLAHALRLTVTAEGVETKEQLQLLEEYQCDYFQGYLLSKPQPMEELRGVLLA